jgi:tetratricopeptide (TPR) repeat protein
MKLYHFTSTRFLKSIMLEGLNKGYIQTKKEKPTKLKEGYIWLTSNNNFIQSWCLREFRSIPYIRSTVRISLEIPKQHYENLHKWMDWGKQFDSYDNLSSFGDPENWYVFHGIIPPSWFIQLDVDFVTQGIEFSENGSYDLALKSYNLALENNPENAEAYFQMGTTYIGMKDFEKSIKCFQKTLEFEPNHIGTLVKLGITYYLKNNIDTAIDYFTDVIELDPNEPLSYYHLGLIFYNKKEYSKAISYYQKTIESDAEFADAFVNLGIIYSLQGDLNEASKNLYNACVLLIKSKKMHKALKVKDLLEELVPNSGLIYSLKEQYFGFYNDNNE